MRWAGREQAAAAPRSPASRLKNDRGRRADPGGWGGHPIEKIVKCRRDSPRTKGVSNFPPFYKRVRMGVKVIPNSDAYREGWERIRWGDCRDSVVKPVPGDCGEVGGLSGPVVERFIPGADYCARVLPGLYGWALDGRDIRDGV